MGLEPIRPNGHKILSLACLPIPPLEHWYIFLRAGDGVQTRDLHLGKVALYQLSYSRLFLKEHPSYEGMAKVNKKITFQNSFTILFLFFLSENKIAKN